MDRSIKWRTAQGKHPVWLPLTVVTAVAVALGALAASVGTDGDTPLQSPDTPPAGVLDGVGRQAAHLPVAPSPPPSSAAARPAAPPSTPPVAKVDATPTPWAAEVVAGSSDRTPQRAASKPTGDETRWRLVRDIQTELTRVGCYDDDIDGDWGASTRRAMAAFTDRVNASLPIKDPDYILLSLIKGYAHTVCGASCPSGQGLDGNGRCVPAAVLAQAARPPRARKPAPADTATETGVATATTRALVTEPVVTGRLSSPPAPIATPPPSPAATQTAAAAPPTPLPDRMALGAPVDAEDVARRSSSGVARVPRPRPVGVSRSPYARPYTPPPRRTAADRQRRMVQDLFQNLNRN